MNKFKKYALIFLPIVVAITIFFLAFVIPASFVLDLSIKTTIITIMFSLLGFSITALTIIAGFMKDSLKVLNAIKKGYVYTIVSLIVWMLIACILSLVALFVNWPSFIFVSTSASGLFVVAYFIYFILTIVIFLVRSNSHNK